MPSPSAGAVETPESLEHAVFSSFRVPDAAGASRLMLVGELDLVTARFAHAAVCSAQDDTPALICDLGDVWFVDFSGLQVLLQAAVRARRNGRRFRLANCPPIVPRMLALINLENALEIS